MTARKPRCIGCGNCVLACPFGVPKMMVELDLMMKCDMCYDRTSTGRKPLCASVCPSGALAYMTRDEVESSRPASRVVDEFQFGAQAIRTKVKMMVPRESPVERIDVLSGMHGEPEGAALLLNVVEEPFLGSDGS
jgi:Fe-S-cluster-containing dehydrogenase component